MPKFNLEIQSSRILVVDINLLVCLNFKYFYINFHSLGFRWVDLFLFKLLVFRFIFICRFHVI